MKGEGSKLAGRVSGKRYHSRSCAAAQSYRARTEQVAEGVGVGEGEGLGSPALGVGVGADDPPPPPQADSAATNANAVPKPNRLRITKLRKLPRYFKCLA